jgi:lipopolysaccharide biosynthesis glycosyltransferase
MFTDLLDSILIINYNVELSNKTLIGQTFTNNTDTLNNFNPITIVVATDNFYAILLAALIKSIEVNHKTGEHIELYILDDGISTANKKHLLSAGSPDMFTYHWHETKNIIPDGIKIPNDHSAFPITTYLRLFSPYILPAETRKMIYLDVDMILLKDISEIWNTDLRENIIAAVVDLSETVGSSWGGIPNYRQLGLNPDAKYFNAGLMAIDVVKWRERNIATKVLDTINANIQFVNFADQYGLNVILINDWLELDKRWNSYSVLDYKDPYLIHFLDIKPIFKSYKANQRYYDEFYKYLNLTSYKNFKPQSDLRRVFRKGLIKVGKIIKRKLFNRANSFGII